MGPSYRNSEPRLPIMEGSPPPPEWRVPKSDWDRPPWNRWTFQHVSEMVPTAPVPRGDGPVAEIPRNERDIEGVAFEAVGGGTMTIAELLDASYTDGFLVAHRGEIVHESYWNSMEPSTLHLSQSVSKSVVSLAAGVLIGEGLLDPMQPVTFYLPELDATAWKGALLRHVLDMTTGVYFGEDYTDPTSEIGKLDIVAGWKPVPPHPDGGEWPEGTFPDCIWDQLQNLDRADWEHGSRFEYRSIETDVLAHAMERVTGQRLPEIVSTRLWQRMGMEADARYTVDAAGYALACGGFNATLRDYARIGLLLVNGGRAAGTQVVPEAWIEDIFSGDHGLFNDYGRHNHPNGQYRNQFWIEDRDRQTVLAKGIFGQLILADREADLVAVKLSSWPDFLSPEFDQNTRRGIRAVQAALGG